MNNKKRQHSFPKNRTGYTSEGLVTEIFGTTDRISIGYHHGEGDKPYIDISDAFVGQNSITTLGIITTGEWNGTILTGQYGGTGISNTGKTILLGGNLTLSGAFSLTLTQTATTNVTLPTTGTLATLAGTETFTNKTLTSPIIAKISNLTSNGFIKTSSGDGTLSIDTTVTTQGNTFNGANQLVKLDGTGKLPAIDGSQLTGISSSGGISAGFVMAMAVAL